MRAHEITKGRRLAQNSVLSLLTSVGVLVAGIVLIPVMIQNFGLELFAVYTVTWILVANLEWLDLGLSRAAGRYVARELSIGTPTSAAVWAWTAIVTQAGLGGIGALGVWFAAPWLVDILGVGSGARDVAILSFRLFALALPVEFAIRSQIGVLQAAQRFGLSSGITLFGSLGMYGAALAAIFTGHDFRFVLYVFFVLRLITFVLCLLTTNLVLPLLATFRPSLLFDTAFKSRLAELTRFGSWMALGLLLGTAILYSGQWMVGVIIGVAALPFYSVPFSLQSRFLFLPLSLIAPLAPAFTALDARQDRPTIELYFLRAHRYLFYSLLPLFFLLFVWSYDILRIWISTDFAERGATVMQVVMLGLVPALMAPLSAALLNSLGRPDILPKLYIAELPLSIGAVIALTYEFGIVGTAWGFVLRAVFELVVLWVIVVRVVGFSSESTALVRRTGAQALATFVAVYTTAVMLRHSSITEASSVLLVTIAVAAYLAVVLKLVMDASDWRFLRNLVRRSELSGA